MKRSLHLMLIALFCLTVLSVSSVRAQWARIPSENTPQILSLGDDALIPAPYYANWLGATLTTNRRNQVTLRWQQQTLVMRRYATQATLNGNTINFATPVLSIAGVTYLPVLPVSTALRVRASVDTRSNIVTLTDPRTREQTRLPIRGAVLTTRGDFNDDGTVETAYGAYLFFNSRYNTWRNGRSVSNPNLPVVFVVRGTTAIWSQSYPSENELVQFSQADLTRDRTPELWFTTRSIGADRTSTYFRAFAGERRRMRNIISNEPGYLLYYSSGGLIAWVSQRPSRLLLFNEQFGDVHAEGPIGLAMITYRWDGNNFVVSDTQRSRGRYTNAIDVLRTQFNIPLTDAAVRSIRQGRVATL